MKLIEEFDLKVINECRCKSNIYGFILFSKINYSVVKVMRDADFIDALHIISGPNWPILFVSPLEKKIIDFNGTEMVLLDILFVFLRKRHTIKVS